RRGARVPPRRPVDAAPVGAPRKRPGSSGFLDPVSSARLLRVPPRLSGRGSQLQELRRPHRLDGLRRRPRPVDADLGAVPRRLSRGGSLGRGRDGGVADTPRRFRAAVHIDRGGGAAPSFPLPPPFPPPPPPPP